MNHEERIWAEKDQWVIQKLSRRKTKDGSYETFWKSILYYPTLETAQNGAHERWSRFALMDGLYDTPEEAYGASYGDHCVRGSTGTLERF